MKLRLIFFVLSFALFKIIATELQFITDKINSMDCLCEKYLYISLL